MSYVCVCVCVTELDHGCTCTVHVTPWAPERSRRTIEWPPGALVRIRRVGVFMGWPAESCWFLLILPESNKTNSFIVLQSQHRGWRNRDWNNGKRDWNAAT